jgi:Gas vesicle synthesis protein GvpL/GvpF
MPDSSSFPANNFCCLLIMLLLYCMIQDDVPIPCAGIAAVGGAELREVSKNGVRYFYSEWRPARQTVEGLKQEILEFHRVNQGILEHATSIPFRFPTHVADESELTSLMEAQSGEYALELKRLRGMVQMKVAVEGSNHANVTTSSGTEYLKQRQIANAPMNAAVEKIKNAAHDIASEIKQTRRGNGTSIFFLVPRERIDDLRNALGDLAFEAKVTFSGPWPPSEFVNCYPELPQAKQT